MTETIQLQNPVSHHFEAFIGYNAQRWQVKALVLLQQVMQPDAYEEVVQEFESLRLGFAWPEGPKFQRAVIEHKIYEHCIVQADEAKGQHLVICGAGPTLNDHAEEWCAKGDQVWGCNSALTWLLKQGHRVTHGFTVDQTEHMVQEWESAPNVPYILASTVHPDLTWHLANNGRDVRYFHNFVGLKKPPVEWPDANGVRGLMEFEDWIYQILYPGTVRAGSGLNTVTRAVDVGLFMGFEKITVVGADCALKLKRRPPDVRVEDKRYQRWLHEEAIMHADGGHALASGATPIVLFATIDSGTPDATLRLRDGSVIEGTVENSERIWAGCGRHVMRNGHARHWATKPDMALSAQWLIHLVRACSGKVELIGDTFPNAIMNKSNEFLRRLPNFKDTNGNVISLFDEPSEAA